MRAARVWTQWGGNAAVIKVNAVIPDTWPPLRVGQKAGPSKGALVSHRGGRRAGSQNMDPGDDRIVFCGTLGPIFLYLRYYKVDLGQEQAADVLYETSVTGAISSMSS